METENFGSLDQLYVQATHCDRMVASSVLLTFSFVGENEQFFPALSSMVLLGRSWQQVNNNLMKEV